MKKILFYFPLIVLLTGFFSCLKDTKNIMLDTQSVVEFTFPQAPASIATNPIRLYSVAYDIAPQAILEIPISYAGGDLPSKDINVTVAYDSSFLKTFNEANYGTTTAGKASYLVALRPDLVTTGNVTIKKGERSGILAVPIKIDQIDFKASYGLPLIITDASGEIISGNFGKIVVRVTPKNMYDGLYRPTAGFIQRYTAPGVPEVGALNGSMVNTIDVIVTTTGPNSVKIAALKWADRTNIGGIDDLIATVDPATNLVTMSSTTATSLRNTSGQVNRYDPKTKAFTLNFDWNPTTTPREVKGLVLTYRATR